MSSRRSPATKKVKSESVTQRAPPMVPSPPAEENLEAKKEALELEIKSLERTLSLLEGKMPRDELSDQLVARDKRIEELNARILSLEASSSGSSDSLSAKSQHIVRLQEERAELTKEVAALQSTVGQLQAQVQAASRDVKEERARAGAKVAEAQGDAEMLNSQLLARTDQVQKMKADIAQLSKIIRDMSQLNADLNEKVLHMNKDMELKNKEHYTATVKAQHFEELEQALITEKSASLTLHKKVQKMMDDRSRLETIEELSRVSQEALRTVEEALAKMGDEARPVLDTVQKVRYDLKKATSQQKSILDDPVLLKQEIRELKAKISELTFDLTRQTAANETHKGRIQFLEREKADIRKEMEEAVERLEKRTKILQEGLDKFRIRTEKAEEDLQRMESEHAKAQNLSVGTQSQLAMLKEQLKEAKTNEEKTEIAYKEGKMKLAKMKLAANAQELSLLSRETKLKQIATKLKLLSDEVWKRDTEILKKDSKLSKLQEEITSLTESMQKLTAESKLKSAQDTASLEAQLSEKEHEIAMLKEMLRSSSKQVQHKEVDLNRFKRRLESLSSVPVEPRVTEFVERVDELMDLREKVRTMRGKMPIPMIKKKLGVDDIPSEKDGILSLISTTIEEAVSALEKDLKVTTKVNISEYIDRITSPGLKSVLAEEQSSSISVGRLASKCRSL